MNYSVCSKRIDITFDEKISAKEIEFIKRMLVNDELIIYINEEGMSIEAEDEVILTDYFNNLVVSFLKKKISFNPFIIIKTKVTDEQINSRDIVSELFTFADEIQDLYFMKFSMVQNNLPYLVGVDSSLTRELIITTTTFMEHDFDVTYYVGEALALVHRLLKNG